MGLVQPEFHHGAAMRKIELLIEAIIFQSRWTLAPFYLGLALSLLLLLYHFIVQLAEFVVKVPHAPNPM